MNLQEIDRLMEKFFNGETSVEEERLLRKLFASGEVPPKWKSTAEYFSFVSEEKQISIGNAVFDSEIAQSFNESRISRIFDLRRPLIYWLAGVAASILLLVAIFVKFDPFPNRIKNTYDDPEMAYVQAKKILLFVSAQMNRGTKELEQMDKFDKGLKDVQVVGSFNKGLDEVARLGDVDKVKNMITNN